MSFNPQILINHLSYAISTDKPLFNDLSLCFSSEKTGLVGKNGVGKSTLLKLIMGELLPEAGSIQRIAKVAYFSQQLDLNLLQSTIAEVLGVGQKLKAYQRIQNGSVDEHDFALLGEDWDIEERVDSQLKMFGLSHLDFDRSLSSLSGGEKTRLLLAKCFFNNPEIIILDEPTNNLDIESGKLLYSAIEKWTGSLLIVSHDRTLLNLMEQIIELTTLGVNIYGGNYEHYLEEKSIVLSANERQLLDAKKALSKTKSSIQTTQEKHQKRQSQGRKLFLSGSIDKLGAGSKKGRSEKTQSRLSTQSESLLKGSEEKLKEAKSKIELSYHINVEMPKTFVPNGKIVLKIENLTFSYDGKIPLIENFNLTIQGPERIAFIGNNGSGKTSLVKIIQGELSSFSGEVYRGVQHIKYLDQEASILEPGLSILENFLKLNPDCNEKQAHHYLAQFLFRNTAALKIVKDLSGGEKLRALLACVLMSDTPPQLLILDEPTNHLDFDSIESIESTLKNYQGALIVISHDPRFLENVGVRKSIHAPFR
ncbi:MAG: ABC-F family ATP-binding cassette domain-containing protein [Proteobacteria bacterium]|nr:ABC-F family ATP-binding cassette domain-containing protein [Pseudomonadota bacterium]